MSEPFIGQICAFGFNFAPRGWATCSGQLLDISQNTALFSLLGVTYGGDGRNTFGLPDLRGRVAVGQGQGPGRSNRSIGQAGGIEHVMLTDNQMPMHKHGIYEANVQAALKCTSQEANQTTPVNNVIAANVRGQTFTRFSNQAPADTMKAGSISLSGNTETTGDSQTHENMQPYQVINYCIALQGIYPSRG